MVEIKVLRNHIFGEFVAPMLRKIRDANVVPRIWDNDHTVWKSDPTGISNRLGWLRIVPIMDQKLSALQVFVDKVRGEGYTQVVLLGMGGSSLAADVFRRVFEKRDGYLQLSVLDSTDPEAIQRYLTDLDLPRTLFIVATKSGGTAETLSFFKTFYNTLLGLMDKNDAGQHFIAITDPGSKLADMAERLRFRKTFLNDATIGGRFSVLSYFGLVPAALMGVDVTKLLSRATQMMDMCGATTGVEENPAVLLGATLGALAIQKIDKATFIASSEIAPFGDWVEQLIAESTGKEGKGILPIVDESLGSLDSYSKDRIFVVLQYRTDIVTQKLVDQLSAMTFPVVHLNLDDLYDLGALFFLWEMATAIAGYCLEIQPFDQPNVEMAKHLARQSIDKYKETGNLDDRDYAPLNANTLLNFLPTAEPGHYISIQAYLAPTPETDLALEELQDYIRLQTGCPVTRGYGPRFLHSTGQLHKGDAGHGLFIQLVSENEDDVPIPDEPGLQKSSMTFSVLKKAQAYGDYQALCDVGRRVIRFSLNGDVSQDIRRLMK